MFQILGTMAIQVVKFSIEGYKIWKIFAQNQHTQRKFLKFEFWIDGELSEMGHHFSNKVILKSILNATLYTIWLHCEALKFWSTFFCDLQKAVGLRSWYSTGSNCRNLDTVVVGHLKTTTCWFKMKFPNWLESYFVFVKFLLPSQNKLSLENISYVIMSVYCEKVTKFENSSS